MSSRDGRTADVCVIGGGVIGLAVAYELCARGVDTIVLESHRVGERAAAGVAAGMVAPLAETDIAHRDLTRLALASHAMYAEFTDRVEAASGQRTGYDTTGTLYVALHRDHRAYLEHLMAIQRDRGLHAQWLSASEVRSREPYISPAASGGLHLADDHQVDPRLLLRALKGAVERHGGALHEGATTTRIDEDADGYAVHFKGASGEVKTITAPKVVLAAGAWTGQLTHPARALPVRPVKGQVLRLRGEPLIRHVVRTPDIYLVPRADGEVVVGATMEEQGFDGRVIAGAVHDLLREAWRVVPGITEFELVETCVGFRPALRDNLPAIGLAREPGLYLATGHFRSGVELAPVTAHMLAELMCNGYRDPLLDVFTPSRFVSADEIGERMGTAP